MNEELVMKLKTAINGAFLFSSAVMINLSYSVASNSSSNIWISQYTHEERKR